jgi:hypothetical protein
MNSKKPFLPCLLLCAIFFAYNMTAQPSGALSRLVGAETAAALVAGEKPVSLQFKAPRLTFVPRHEAVKKIADELIQNLKPGFLVEKLYLFPKPPSRARSWTSDERAALYNRMLAVSTLAGLEYYSESRKEMRVFYETSTVVSAHDGKQSVADPAYAVPPSELTLYARQKDLSFGDNIYRYDYFAYSDALVFVQQNITALSYGIIPAVGKNNLRSLVAVVDANEYLLVYVASLAKAASVPGMNDRIGHSFSNRADAVLKWFSGQAEKTFTSSGR